MDRDGVEALLKAGIFEAKSGDPARAQELLLQVIDADRENEPAWLWLSSVVDSDENRRICLENVLVLNPNSEPAQRGLARMDTRAGRSKPAAAESRRVRREVRREIAPLTPAAAILYPERQIKEWYQPDEIPLRQSSAVSYEVASKYDDVWERQDDICVYCAAGLSYDDTRCPQCRQHLMVSAYRYPRASTDLTLYGVFLLGVAQLYFVQILLDIITGESLVLALWHGILFAIMVFLTVGVFRRKFWAYVASMVISLLILAGSLLTIATGPVAEETASQTVQGDLIETLTDSGILDVANAVSSFLVPLQLVAVALVLLYGLVKVGPDFERVRSRITAEVDKGLADAPGFYSRGKEYAAEKKWAGAVLHWQRAAALDPHQVYYQRSLGDAYARLGFYERSLDVLQSAYDSSTNEEMKSAIAAQSELVRQAKERRPAIGQEKIV